MNEAEANERLAVTRRGADYIREVLRVYGGQHAVAGYEADAQALADVRTLDEWAEANPENAFQTTLGEPTATERWCCWRNADPCDVGVCCYFYGPTPEAARAKAATWVGEQETGDPGGNIGGLL